MFVFKRGMEGRSGEKIGFGVRWTWVSILALSLNSSVILGKILNCLRFSLGFKIYSLGFCGTQIRN